MRSYFYGELKLVKHHLCITNTDQKWSIKSIFLIYNFHLISIFPLSNIIRAGSPGKTLNKKNTRVNIQKEQKRNKLFF